MGFRKRKLDLGGGAVPQAANSGQAVGPEAALSRTQSLAVVLWAGGCHRLGPGWLLAAPFWQPPSGGFLRWPSPGSARGSGVGGTWCFGPSVEVLKWRLSGSRHWVWCLQWANGVSNLWYSEIGSIGADGNATTACPSLGSPMQVLQPAPRPHRVIGVKVFGILPRLFLGSGTLILCYQQQKAKPHSTLPENTLRCLINNLHHIHVPWCIWFKG